MASLTDDNAVLAGIASIHYCNIHTTRYKIASSAILVPLRFYPSESVPRKGILPGRSRRVRNAKSRMARRRTEPEASRQGPGGAAGVRSSLHRANHDSFDKMLLHQRIEA